MLFSSYVLEPKESSRWSYLYIFSRQRVAILFADTIYFGATCFF